MWGATCLTHQKRPAQIDPLHLVPQLAVDFGATRFLHAARTARVVNEHADSSEALDGGGDQRRDRGSSLSRRMALATNSPRARRRSPAPNTCSRAMSAIIRVRPGGERSRVMPADAFSQPV